MAIRNIVLIDEDKCNGCGDCVTSCAEGAIEIIDGKAKLVSEIYCDGLGACLGSCPMDAISIEKRESAEFDEAATEDHLEKMKQKETAQPKSPCQCPGTMMQSFKSDAGDASSAGDVSSQLAQWPLQLTLLSPQTPYFKGADLMLTADCVPFAMGDFHSKLLKGKAIAIACPKLDNIDPYIEKVAEIIKVNDLKSLTVVHMMVPCCSGMTHIAKQAIALSGVDMKFEDITIDLQGNICNTETL
ncbi:MAG: 4Fe-4S dicluster domain-containing protein [Planctomycetes bacterium]|nr:4Fe-4S dicluster domain-containing protein [Planctomycetota bacterium]